jgi:hypothetical protein
MAYLHLIFRRVPNSKIAVVITNAPDDILERNSVDYYVEQHKTPASKEFLQEIKERSDGKVCFVSNPNLEKELFGSSEERRERSLENLRIILNSFYHL